MLKSKIGTLEAIMAFLTIIVTHTISSLPRQILVFTKSATIINLIYVSLIAIFIAYLIFKLFKNFPGSDIIDVSEFVGGKPFKNIVGILFIAYFVTTSGILLRNCCEILKILYFPMTEITFIILLFIIALCIANRLNFSATLKTNLIILPMVLLSMIFLFFANMNKFVPQNIFPILGDGIFNTFVLGLGNLSAFSGISFLYFLPPLLKEPEKFKKIAIISVVITAVYLILCVSTLLFMFSFFLESNEITPLYNATRYIEFGNFFQRLESLFLLSWILAFACYLSIVSKFSMNIFKKITNLEASKPLIDIFSLLFFAIALVPKNYAISESFETKIYPYLMFTLYIFVGLSILIIANILHHKSQRFNYMQNKEGIPYE